MEEDELARRVGAHVVLETVEPEVHRPAKTGERVLRRLARRAAVAEDPRGALDELAVDAGVVQPFVHG